MGRRRRGFEVPVAVALFFAALGACGTVDEESAPGDERVLTEADAGTEAVFSPGERFEIRLESNASTGYRWKLLDPEGAAPFDLVTSDYSVAESTLVGAAGTEVWVFEAAAELATGELRMVYVRPFDDPPVPAASFALTVRVEE